MRMDACFVLLQDENGLGRIDLDFQSDLGDDESRILGIRLHNLLVVYVHLPNVVLLLV